MLNGIAVPANNVFERSYYICMPYHIALELRVCEKLIAYKLQPSGSMTIQKNFFMLRNWVVVQC